MKKTIITILILAFHNAILACDLCKSNQPKGFENLTHGEGPQGNLDYLIMGVAIIIVGYTLTMSIKYLVRPKENETDHVKNLVIEDKNVSV
ncbi:MAG: hypothetical protein CML02_18135 [Pseudooceanicola sp.]|nr:hypothetical protein [Pseudooceanicola sp.]|tara:strand:- start:1835 stop:2107 length:273 start_codon:yes stop_codon:yes gene_type:complete